MNKLNQFALILFAIFCIMLAPNNVDARVCFAAADDENCGSMNSFGDYTDPAVETADQCIKAGYPDSATNCRNDPAKQISEYCPYNNDYVKCCGLEYGYSSCVYPLMDNGKCGKKYKCICDPVKYKYTTESCRALSYNNYPGGASCASIMYNPSSATSVVDTRFTECKCDRALYPKTDSDCKALGSQTNGNTCTDSNGESFYASCLCGPKFQVITTSCEFGTHWQAPLCQQGDVWKAEKCCECSAYPYKDKTDPSVSSFISCEDDNGCTRGANRYKATGCNRGYKLDSNGVCVPKTCNEVITDWFSDPSYPSRKNNYTHLTPANQSFRDHKNTVVIGENIRPTYIYRGKYYYSGFQFGKMQGDSLIIERCKKKPVVTWTYSNFDGSSGSIYLYGLSMDFTGTPSIGHDFTCYNCTIKAGNITFNAYTYISADSQYLSEAHEPMNFKSTGTITINNSFYSYFTSFDANNIMVMNRNNRIVKFDTKMKSGSRGAFNANSFSVRGLASLNNAEATVRATCVGCTYSGGGSYGVEFAETQTSSNFALYNTVYYLYKYPSTYNELHMSASSMFGSHNYGDSTIVLSTGNKYYISMVRFFRYCSNGSHCPNTAYPYITGGGSTSSISQQCGKYCSDTQNKGDRPDDIRCKINGNGTKTHLQGGRTHPDCRWFDKGNDIQIDYFRFGNK